METMKKISKILIFICIFLTYSSASIEAGESFDFKIETTQNNQEFAFWVDDAQDFEVDWGEGFEAPHSESKLFTHEYSSPGEHLVKVKGSAERISFYGAGDGTPELLIDILTPVTDGVEGITSAKEMFRGANNITEFTAEDFFDDTSGNVTDMSGMFRGASSFDGHIGNWDVSNVTSTNKMFFGARSFNKCIKDWDVSSLTNMESMFAYCNYFSEDLSRWNVSNVENMASLFRQNLIFNHDIGNWDVSNVKNMKSMFYRAEIFNQDIGGWDVSSVEDMSGMFFAANRFNRYIGAWDVSNVEDMSAMFGSASLFNHSIEGWDVSNVTSMRNMFSFAESFNQDIGGWDVSNVEDMSSMFKSARGFNQNIAEWDVSNVKNFDNFLHSSLLHIEAYNKLLIRWSDLDIQKNINFHGGRSKYHMGLPELKREHIIDEFNWTFKDSGNSGEVYSLKNYTYNFIYHTQIAKITISTSAFDYSAKAEVNELSPSQKEATEQADKKLPREAESRTIPLRDYKIVDIEGKETGPSENPEAITLRFYFPSNIVYVDFNNIKIARLCEDSKKWSEYESFTLNTEERWIETKKDALSVHTLIKYPHETLDNVYVYPNPFKPHERKHRSAYGGRGIKFAGLPNKAEIRIFNIAGDLIDELNHANSTSLRWEEAENIGSGVYILVVNHNGDMKTKKFSIVK